MKKNEKNKVSEEKQNELKNLENQLKRALADYQNLEKRITEERLNWIRLANRDLLLKLLPGIDSLVLAEKHNQDEGVKVSIAHFMDVLKEAGVSKIETEGADFNPHLMEAVSTMEGIDGKVLEEVRAGYMLYDQVLRPVQVIVGKQVES